MMRSFQKKPSFRMLLLKDATQTVRFKNEDSNNNLPMIVTINQGDNPALKDLLNRYHQREDLGAEKIRKNEKIFDEIVSKLTNLSTGSIDRLRVLLKNNHYSLLKVLNLYEKFNYNAKKIKGEIEKLLERDQEDLNDVPHSPSLHSKMHKLNAFKQIIHEMLVRYQLISQKQQKLFFYLYLEEDMVILGAFEIYLLTGELQDFVENLQIIDKYHFFKTNLDLDEIEQFDENIEYQLSLLFAYKKYLNSEQRTSLEKIVRAGDQSLLTLFRSFQENKDKSHFLKRLVKFAEEKTKELHKLEKKMIESKMNGSEKEKNLDTLETFRASKFLKNVKYYNLIEKLVVDNHKLIQTVFEIYEMTKDKADFIENIGLIYNLAYKSSLFSLSFFQTVFFIDFFSFFEIFKDFFH